MLFPEYKEKHEHVKQRRVMLVYTLFSPFVRKTCAGTANWQRSFQYSSHGG